MKQKPIPSQTTAILYQCPTAQEQRPSFLSKVKVNVKEFAMFSGVSLIAWPPVTYIVEKVFGG